MDDTEQPRQQTVEQSPEGELSASLARLQLSTRDAVTLPALLSSSDAPLGDDPIRRAMRMAIEATPRAVALLISIIDGELLAKSDDRRKAAINLIEIAKGDGAPPGGKRIGEMTAAELRELRDKLREQERVIDAEVEVIPDGQ